MKLQSSFAKVNPDSKNGFNWANPEHSHNSIFQWISKHKLQIDESYQRGAASKTRIDFIAKNWDWQLVGTLSVFARGKGEYFVYDGGHRLRAALLRDDIDRLPCIVFDSNAGIENEARAFVGKNTLLTNVSATDRYKAAVLAGEPVCSHAANILANLGLEVVRGGASRNQVSCIGSIISAVSRNAAVAESVLKFCRDMIRESHISGQVFWGLFLVCHHFADEVDILRKYGKVLKRMSMEEIETYIRRYKAEVGGRGQALDGKAVLRLLNKGRRVRLEW